ncbi:NucA/NucB deoxyribonuclease domain-containing protein [Streptomyces decoyicus]|uniref:NucA/NucB deoxyribonuclease domain-containing protein n=1 Tax=Streptomyces decoyicus TaxID=249567 RepID=UPI000AEDB768|nr:hypothetical protein [Streptomyces decoyicus]QZY15184.1 hypothetical protein K7C20_07900 [Streptomyces decoyicus]
MHTSRRIALAAAGAGLSLAAALLAPASAPAAPAPSGSGPLQTVGPAGEAPTPKSAGAVTLADQPSCDSVQQELDGYAAQGIDSVSCLEQQPVEAPQSTERAARSAVKAAVSARAVEEQLSAAPGCKVTMGQWFYTRLDACGSLQLKYDVFDTRTKKTIGGATFTANQEIQLAARSGVWHTADSLTLNTAWGAAKGLRAAWKTECTNGACGASSAWSGSLPIAKGKVLDGTTTHTWKAGQSTQGFNTKTTVTITGAGQILLYPASFTPPGKMTIRCDSVASGKSVGCVFPSFTPTLELPLNHRGHVNVAWSMQSLTDHWGWEGKGSPLTREANDSVINDNRGKVCDSTFTKDATVPDDSCDEFPFAATNQSGAQLGLTGKDCAQIRPDLPANGRWTVSYVNNTANRRCTIGHVPNGENGSVGGSLSIFYQNNRVLDDEKFWLAVR